MKKMIKTLFIASLVIMSACGTTQNETEKKTVETEKKEQVFDVTQLTDRLEVEDEMLDTTTLFEVTENDTARKFFVHPAELDLSEAREEKVTVCVWNDDSTIQAFEKQVKIGSDEQIAQVKKEKGEKVAKAEEKKETTTTEEKKESEKSKEETNSEQTEEKETETTTNTQAPTSESTENAQTVATTPTPTEAPKYTYQCWNGQWAYDASGCPAQPTSAPVVANTPAPSNPQPTPVPSTPQPAQPTPVPSTPQPEKKCWTVHHDAEYTTVTTPAVYKTVHHDAVYENKKIIDQTAACWKEYVGTREYIQCKICGMKLYDYDSANQHTTYAHDRPAGYVGGAEAIEEEVCRDEISHYEQVLVSNAYDEQVLVTPAKTENVLVKAAWDETVCETK